MIIIEANEIPKSVFLHYAKTNNGPISKALKEYGIIDTILDDVEEKYLYPSQAWASISTGLDAEKHGIRWYNDAKSTSNFYWRQASRNFKKVALMNVLHTGSITEEEIKNYCFVFPDFFSTNPKVNLKKYIPFQNFNHLMSVSSGRKTSKKEILINGIIDFFKYPLPNAWGISIKDTLKWIELIYSSRNDNEVLRNAQFLLQARIFLNEILKGNGSDLSVIFTNHVASCLHRNFHDLEKNHSDDKIKKIKINLSMKILDQFINECIINFPKREIVLISAIGQVQNKNISDDYKKKNSVDYKITDLNKFLNFFKINNTDVKILYEMIPQYTFQFKSNLEKEHFIKKINSAGSDPKAMRFGYYVPPGKGNKSTKGFFCHADSNGNRVTCTMTVRPNKEGNVLINGNNVSYKDLGFSSLKVSDFHNGEHSKFGCLISMNRKIDNSFMHFSEIKDYILNHV